jgi:hypothetical protein
MPSPWQSPLAAQPTDGQLCWIRSSYFTEPVAATYHAATLDFTLLAGHVIVTGAGDADTNGTYLALTSPAQQIGYYNTNGQRWLFYDTNNGAWSFEDDAFNLDGHVYYIGAEATSILGTYVPASGPSPGPSVTVSPVFPMWAVERWAPNPS